MRKEIFMNDSKVLAFIFGLIPMTLIQYWYWNWLIDQLLGGTDIELFTVVIVVTILYCAYERFFIYTVIFPNTTFRDRIPLAVMWIVECVVGRIVSVTTINDLWSDPEFGPGLLTIWCPITGVIMVVSFLVLRTILYWKKKNR